MANNYYERGDRLNILLADELPEEMTGTQDTQHICGKCTWYSFAKLESICRKTGKEVAYFANKECFTTDKDMDMEEKNNAKPVAETGTQVCKECGRTLPLEDFQRRRNGKIDTVCKACRADKVRIGIARKKAVKVENPGIVVASEEVENAKRVEIAQLSRYLTDFKMAGIALWGMLPGKEEDIDQIIKAEWAVPFCREIYAAAAELKRDGANVIPAIVSRRFGSIGRTFVEALGDTFYELAQECDTSEQTIKEEKTSVKDVLTKAGIKPYKDGNQWCILAGDNLQEGICGFGDTIEDALCEFLTDVFKSQNEQKPAESEDERIRKAIIELLKEVGRDDTGISENAKCMIAYLEKQKDITSVASIQEAYRKGFNNAIEAVKQKPEKYGLQKEVKWSPSECEMGVLYKLCYVSNQITDEDDTELTRLYQDLKREYFNGHSFENMFPKENQEEQKPEVISLGTYVADFSDAALLDELRRRGYKGRISKCEEVEI